MSWNYDYSEEEPVESSPTLPAVFEWSGNVHTVPFYRFVVGLFHGRQP